MQPLFHIKDAVMPKRIYILRNEFGNEELLELQLSGKKRMDASAFLNGMKDIAYYECLKKDVSDDF